METQNRVSLTALYTAQHWIKGGYPFAKYFDTLRGRLVYWLSALVSRLPFVGQGIRYYNQQLWLRHQVVERFIETYKPDVLIDLGCGLSPRGIARAKATPGLKVLEGDLAFIVSIKKALLEPCLPQENYQLQTVDLLKDSLESLTAGLSPSDRVLVITEGVIDYFTFEQKRAVWTRLNELVAFFEEAAYLQEVNLTLGSPRLTQLIARVLGVTVEDRMYPTGDAALEDLRACGFATVDKLDHPFDLPPQDLADVPQEAIGWEMVVARKR